MGDTRRAMRRKGNVSSQSRLAEKKLMVVQLQLLLEIKRISLIT